MQTSNAAPFAAQVAVVTGAAHGIGRAAALRLARDGADVALLDRDADALATLTEDIGAFGRRALPIALDCTREAELKAAFGRIAAMLGDVDILLNNVGQGPRERMSTFRDADLDTLDFLLAINLKTAIVCSHQVVPAMCARRHGKIINITTEAAVNGAPRCWDYAAAKAGVIGFTRALAMELAPFGVTVNAIGPGATRTRALEQTPKDQLDQVIAGIPMGRIGEPDDIANAVAFFASDQSSYITGQTLLVNGGNWML
ncbi:sugar dehydrogenase [Pandoraea terrae]|uniref:Sugar dehydrogenase n=1 Tax=Pandoraea terrae TaxID=1537710 RepID=A0A5E4S0L8_9BURK|nr:SDR family NAD(P)-dependent oxidoreductase [Pandoraea terrae]VVD68681.1 sugar dehydrogenase [Pandoraea terrae]